MVHLSHTKRHVYYHVVAWVLYAFYYWGINRLNNNISWTEVLISVPFFMLIAYTAYIVLRLAAARGHHVAYALLWWCLCVAYAALAFLIVYEWGPAMGVKMYLDGRSFSSSRFMQLMITMISNYTFFGTAYFFIRRSMKKERARAREAEGRLAEMQGRRDAEEQKRYFEFNTLAAQMSVHNMANWVNRWAEELHRTQTALAIEMEKAHELTVYYMDAQKMGSGERVPLRRELELLGYYIDLVNGEGAGKRYIEWDVLEDTQGLLILPTTFISLFENALKHGKSRDARQPIRMRLGREDGVLVFGCDNAIAERSRRISHGRGLMNLKRRLEICYGDRAVFRFGKQGDRYVVEVKIKQPYK